MFYALYRALGDAQFDRMVSSYFQTFRASGSTTDESVEHLKSKSPNDLGRVFDDWLYTTAWYDRLTSGESLEEVISTY